MVGEYTMRRCARGDDAGARRNPEERRISNVNLPGKDKGGPSKGGFLNNLLFS